MEGPRRVQYSKRKSTVPIKKNFGECAIPPMKSLLQSQKDLCRVSTEDLKENQDSFNEVTFLCFADETAIAFKDLASISVELLNLLKSLHLCTLHENEVIFLNDTYKPLGTSDNLKHKNCSTQTLCVMRLFPSFARFRVDSIFTLLGKYAAGIRYTLEMCSLQKHLSGISPREDDDTNQSVSSIEDDFVTALEHLNEDEPAKMINSGHVTPEKCQDATLQTIFGRHLEYNDPKMNSIHWKPSVKSSASLANILELPSSIKNSVTTSVSDPWIQRSFFRTHNSSDQSVNLFHKTLLSSSPAESSESDCSSPSPVIFLDEEGYQKSLKAKLQLPKIPVMKDGIEDSDSEVGEFFDSFDQFDEQEPLENSSKHVKHPVLDLPSPKKVTSYKKSISATAAMNPQKFKFDCPTLPAHVRKPTPRKPESPYSNLLDIPGSPWPVKTSGNESRDLFSPVRSSAFSPLAGCFTTECLCRRGINRDAVNQNHSLLCHTYSDFANNISFEILGSVFNSRSSSLCRCVQDISNNNRIVSKEEKVLSAKSCERSSGKELVKKGKSKCKSLVIKDRIQKFASELVEKSLGSAFKDLQQGVSSCTAALYNLAAKLTSSVFQMAFYEIGRQQAFSLKKKAINGLAGFLVSEAITSALKELHSVKQQIVSNTVAKFAANLAEELIFEGIMEVCQFSYPLAPAVSQSFHNDKVVLSYAKDLSESVIQEAFIELSQVDVAFTTQAAICISMDNVKYVHAERTLQSTQTSSVSSECRDKLPIALSQIQDFRKEYTVQKALFCTSGIASSIPVPLAGNILRQNHILLEDVKVRNCSASEASMKFYSDSKKNGQGEVTSVRNIYLTRNNECNSHILCTQRDFEQANNPEVRTEMQKISNFSGAMVDMIVTEAYETVTSSRSSTSADKYTDMYTEKMPYLQCIGEDTCKNMFANYLSKRIVKQSVDETKSACSSTSEKLAYCVGLGANNKTNVKELHCTVKHFEKNKNIPVIVGQQQMPLNSISKFHVTPVSSNKCLLLESKDYVQEKKRHVTSACTSVPSALTFVKYAEDFLEPENQSVKSLNSVQEKPNMYKSARYSGFACERDSSEINICNSSASNYEDAHQMGEKLNIRGNPCVIPDTPPPTPLVASQANSEWTLRKLTKKLKGELAKEFAPATPPSTPYRSEADGAYENEHNYIEKEEFMLKLMRSLSEEIESSGDEELSETLDDRAQPSLRTVEYADHLATQIIAMATEMAASYIDDKAFQMENAKCCQVRNKRCEYTAFTNDPEKNLHSLWAYAGDMAGKVISEAKKLIKSRHCKLLRLKQINCQLDSLHPKNPCHDRWSKDRRYSLAQQCSKETDPFILSIPQSSEAPGLTSKYPSCESVTDEYADHIIQILKREGGHSELIMDQFASRLAYKSIKSGMQQAARKLRMKCSRKTGLAKNPKLHSKVELFDKVKNEADIKKQNSNVHELGKKTYGNKCSLQRTEYTKLIDYSESLAYNITCDVRRNLMSATCLPKSLTDSCLYKKSKVDEITDLKTFSETLSPLDYKQKLYHSTGNLNDYTYRDGVLHSIEQYAKKVVDDTLEASLESATLQTTEHWTKTDKSTYTEKLSPFSAISCRFCRMKEHQCSPGGSPLQLTGPDYQAKAWQVPKMSVICPKSHILHLDIPKIHIDVDDKVVYAENVIATAFDKTERQLSNTSLTADSGIGQDGVSFAESLTTEIMTSCMTNIGPVVNISSVGKEGFNYAESMASQQMSLSTGDDSTGSWSNLSFEDEHPDENSSFLHLSDSNGNSSSWSSLGLEGDMYDENLSFPTSESDGMEDKKEELKDSTEGVENTRKVLMIVNIDMGPCMVDSQLRVALQWLIASEADVAELQFHDAITEEFVLLSNELQERGWKVGDLFQAVLKYCEIMEKVTDEENTLESKTFFEWLQEYF